MFCDRERDKLEIAWLSNHDYLTGLKNRRSMQRYIEGYFDRRGQPSSFGAMMIDIDHFKLYNDSYGHMKGDSFLERIGAALVQMDEELGVGIFRCGGEEFAVLCPDKTLEEVKSAARRIHAHIKAETATQRDEVRKILTVSIGVQYAPRIDGTRDIYRLLNKANTALYQAKEQGRNRIVIRE